MEKIRIFLGYAIGVVLASPGLYVIFGFCWALLTPIDVEKAVSTPDPAITHGVLFQNGRTTLEFSERFWTMSGTGWIIGMERRATCYVAVTGSATCLRYGSPIMEADFAKMARHWRAEERRRMLEEASRSASQT